MPGHEKTPDSPCLTRATRMHAGIQADNPWNPVTDTPRFDFHCHSLASDGALTPTELVGRAAAAGVELLALTDHDTLAGQAEARVAADQAGLRLLPGIEVSVAWITVSCTLSASGLIPSIQRSVRWSRRSSRLAPAGPSGSAPNWIRPPALPIAISTLSGCPDTPHRAGPGLRRCWWPPARCATSNMPSIAF